MAKTKYDDVLEQLEIIKKQADYCLAKKQNDKDAEIFGRTASALKNEVNRLFWEEHDSLRAMNEDVCPPGTYDCTEYCSATPC